MKSKEKNRILSLINDNYVIERLCPNCRITECMMIAHPEKKDSLLCPQCGKVEEILTEGKLVDEDAHEPLVCYVDDKKNLRLEEQEIKELEKHGMKVKFVQRL